MNDAPSSGGGAEAPLVSIITPAYNHRRFVGACVQSVIDQSEPRWEQIVVDDGSSDGTADVAAESGDPRVRVVRSHHRGIMRLSETYNLALEMARGTYVAVLEADDLWPADKLERQLPAVDRPDVVLSWGQAVEVNRSGVPGRVIPSDQVIAAAVGRSEGATLRALLLNNDIPACTVICRRSALLEVGGFQQPEGVPNVDYPTWLALSRLGRFAPVAGVLGSWRRHDAQVSTTMSAEMLTNISWATSFVRALPEAERRRLGISVAEARRIERRRFADVAMANGRMAIRMGLRRQALGQFRKALATGSPATRSKAALALAAAAFHVDLDRAAAARARLRRRGRRAG